MSSFALQEFAARTAPGGGLAEFPGGAYRPDSTAWAVIAWSAMQGPAGEEELWRERLAAGQQADGSIPLSDEFPETFWPTPLAVLAWKPSENYRQPALKALGFLLKVSGMHWKREKDSPLTHDTALQGWPWVAGTHSWVEPTALCLMALQETEWQGHPRAVEATEMLLDRQLPQGGWNYGNLKVFDRQMDPFPETTGMALQALAGRVSERRVENSLHRLGAALREAATPFSLGWALLGLAAWGRRPAEADALIAGCLRRNPPKSHGTTDLSILLLASLSPGEAQKHLEVT